MSAQTSVSGATPPTDAVPGFQQPAKPGGSSCIIDCTNCFYLSREALNLKKKRRMSDATGLRGRDD